MPFAVLRDRLKTREAKVCHIGLGQVGLFQAIESALAGFYTEAVDEDARKIASLMEGSSYIDDISDSLLLQATSTDRLVFRTGSDGIGSADIVVLSAPTPISEGVPDLRPFKRMCEAVAQNATPGQLVVVRSTLFPGNTESILVTRLVQNELIPGDRVHVVVAPERCNVGSRQPLDATIPRLIGGVTPSCAQAGTDFYQAFGALTVQVSARVAEAAKMLENVFRFVNISLVNELATICERLEVDPMDVVAAAATKPFGFMAFTPGPGIGGLQMTAPPAYWCDGARRLGVSAPTVRGAISANNLAIRRVMQAIESSLNGKSLRGASVLIVGVSYKPATADTRDSIATHVIEDLLRQGAEVSYADDLVAHFEVGGTPIPRIDLSRLDLVRAADVLVLLSVAASDWLSSVVRVANTVVDPGHVLKELSL